MMRTHGLDDATLDWLIVYLLHTEKEKIHLFKVHFNIGLIKNHGFVEFV